MASHQTSGLSDSVDDTAELSDNDDAAAPREADADATPGTAFGLATGGAQKRKKSRGKRTPAGRKEGAVKARKKKNGFVNVPGRAFRALEGRNSLATGNERSCAQDGLVNGANRLGVKVTKKQVYADTLPAVGDTAVGAIVDYARETLGIEMLNTRVPTTLGVSLFCVGGCAENALLQLDTGVFFVELTVSQEGKPDDAHIVVYDAGYTVHEGRDERYYQPLFDAGYSRDRFHLIHGAILDNERDTPVKFLEPSDRETAVGADGKTTYKARAVFDSLFPFASRVRVVGAWLMRPLA